MSSRGHRSTPRRADSENVELGSLSEPALPKHRFHRADIEIAYDQIGQGSAIVFLHGFPDLEGTFAAQIADLSRDHRVIAPRLRGYPPSSCPDVIERYRLPDVASDIEALIEHLDARDVTLVGHDWGGALAQVLCLKRPDLIRRLILLNAPPLSTFDALVGSDPDQQALSKYTWAYLSHRPGDTLDVALATRTIRDPVWRARVAAYLTAHPLDGMLAYYKANYPAPPYVPTRPAGHVFTTPTLIIWGEEEEYFSSSALEGLSKYFAHPLLIERVGGAGHWVHRDAAERVTARIRSWIESPLPDAAPLA